MVHRKINFIVMVRQLSSRRQAGGGAHLYKNIFFFLFFFNGLLSAKEGWEGNSEFTLFKEYKELMKMQKESLPHISRCQHPGPPGWRPRCRTHAHHN